MLTVPPTMPSRCTMRLGGGSSAGGGNGVGISGVTTGTGGVGVAGGVSTVVVGGAAMGGAFSTIVGVGTTGGGVAGSVGALCVRNCAATKPKAFVGASISVHSPLVVTVLTASPFTNVPMTL